MLSALRAVGLAARIIRLGDPPHARGQIQVEMPVNGRARFVLAAKSSDAGVTWRVLWDGNDSVAGLRRRRAAEKTAAFTTMMAVLARGRPVIQAELPV